MNPVVHAVNYQQMFVSVKRQTGGAGQLSLAIAGAAPTGDECSVGFEDRYAVQEVVGHVDLSGAVQDDAPGPDELPVGLPVAPELAEELVVQCHLADALAQLLSAPVEDEETVPSAAMSKSWGVQKPWPDMPYMPRQKL